MNSLRRVSTLASHFMRWWLAELRASVPERLYLLIGARHVLVVATIEGDRLRLCRHDNAYGQEIGQLSLAEEEPLALRRKIVELIAAAGLRTYDFVACMAPGEILRRTIDLPLEATENLREVVTVELDRYAPFKSGEDVCFDHHVVAADPAGRRIQVELVIASRSAVEQTRDLLRACGVEARRIGAFAAGRAAGQHFMNLVSEDVSGNGGRTRRQIASSLSGLAALLATLAVYVPLHQKAELLAAYQGRLERSRAEVGEVETLRSRVTEMMATAQLLTDRRHGRPPVVAVLDEITQRLGDDTWLLEFRLRGDQLVVSGYSGAASALVAVLEASDMLADVRFNAPVTADPFVGQERFSLTARISAPPTHAPHQEAPRQMAEQRS